MQVSISEKFFDDFFDRFDADRNGFIDLQEFQV
jgi:Ca2+-binding EF-hand superfamily protein